MNSRKQHVLETASSLFVEKGYVSTSIQDILEKANISKGTFYNYFSSKAECLRAILESIADEIDVRRQEAAAGKQKNDLDVLTDQIIIRLNIQKEQNLFLLYESVFYSMDGELKALAQNQYLAELQWLEVRITEVSGEEAAPYALENAVMLMGMMRHLIYTWRTTTEKDLPVKPLAAFAVRRMQASLQDQILKQDTFLDGLTLKTAEKQQEEKLVTKLQKIAVTLPHKEHTELVDFIAGELGEASPRLFLLESVLSTLRQGQILEDRLINEIEDQLARLRTTRH